ncbi:MAG: PQQ-binding-like beta-propeller repeat protein [Planctomycetales bacterium]|nr:PQQ-binding-like beta-propeller repeat protein [bacterium]UNM09215.1 MAG: PQQ-binding-like beta-propeller repeat protein [Planctomycetales bacterium]
MRSLSVPPQDERDRITLSYSGGALRWHYRNTGDYDQNGEVNAADLIPLAKLLGTSGGPFEFTSIESVVDGDGNGEINIADVAPIAQHYGVRLTGYSIYSSGSQLDYPGAGGLAANGTGTTELGTVLLTDSTSSPTGRRSFSFATLQVPGISYWLVTADDAVDGAVSERLGIDNWFSYQMDNRNSGQSPFCGPQHGIVRWKKDFGTNLMDSVVLTADGNIITGTLNGELISLDADGRLAWTQELGNFYCSVPAIGTQGDIYVSTREGTLVSLSSDGTINWQVPGEPARYRWNNPVAAENGDIYIGQEEAGLAAYSPSGNLLWTVPMEDGMHGTPAIGSDGRIYAAREQIIAVNPDGSLSWQDELQSRCVGSVSISPEGILTHYDLYGILNMRTADGQLLSDPLDFDQDFGGYKASPVHSHDGSMLAISEARYLARLDHNGNIEWKYGTELYQNSAAVLDASGRAYVCSEGGLLICLSPSGQLEWSFQTSGNISSSPVITARGELLLCDISGNLYCFGDPQRVRGLTALPDSEQQRIVLGWEGSSGATGYSLQLRTGGVQPGAWQELGEPGPDARTFSHDDSLPAGLACRPGVDYQYRISAIYDGFNEMTWCEPAGSRLEPSPTDGPQWPTLGNDKSRRGSTQNIGSRNAELLWQYNLQDIYYNSYYYGSSPVIGSDGTVYSAGLDRMLHVYWPDGSVRWEVETYNPAVSTPTLDEDGNIYLGLLDGMICYNPDGSFRWNYATTETVGGSVLVTDSLVVFGCRDGVLRALSRNGELLWEYDTGNAIEYAPTQSPSGRLLCTNSRGRLFQLNTDGQLEWVSAASNSGASAPAVGLDGTAYYIDGIDQLHAVSAAGKLLWSFELGGQGEERMPVLGPDGSIYAGGEEGELHRISPLGYSLRTYQVEGSIVSPVAVDGAGSIFCGTLEGNVLAYDSSGALLWKRSTESGIISAPAISASGNVYIGGLNNRIFAFGVNNGN